MRPDKDTVMLYIANTLASRSTCTRRNVGCILVNDRGHIIGTGYNGVAAGMPHCLDFPCEAAKAKSGTNLDGCGAIHAEQNALLQCSDPWAIDTCYVTASPCITCVKLLMNTSCQRIVYGYEYPHPDARDLAVEAGIGWVQLKEN